MNWSRLQFNQCPQCSRILTRDADLKGYHCPCGFHIANGKYQAIVDKIHLAEQKSMKHLKDNKVDLENL